MPAPRSPKYHRTHGSESAAYLTPFPNADEDNEFRPLTDSHAFSASSSTVVPQRSTRTPSPSPSEIEFVEANQRTFTDKVKRIFTKKWLKSHVVFLIVLAVIITISVLTTVFQTKIIKALIVPSEKFKELKGSWAIGVVVTAIWCFPPLFFQEVIHMLSGIIWGIEIGMLVIAAGTIIGEVACFWVFKLACTSRMEKIKRKRIFYACLSKVVQTGGFTIAVLVRYSTIPPHWGTALFATCGLNFWWFLAASIVSLPKQLIGVYTGVLFEEAGKNPSKRAQDITISYVVQGVTIIVSIVAFEVIRKRTNNVSEEVIYERRKARQEKIDTLSYKDQYPPSSYQGSRLSLDTPFDPNNSQTMPTLYDPVALQPRADQAPPAGAGPAYIPGSRSPSPVPMQESKRPIEPPRYNGAGDNNV